MPNSLKKIFAVFIVVAALPLGFIIYEFSSLNEDEELFHKIYAGQLDAILYSVNQYSFDVTAGWVNEVSNALVYKETRQEEIAKISEVISKTGAVKYVYLFNTSGSFEGISINGNGDDKLDKKLTLLSEENREVIEKLIKYKQAGYQKLEGLDSAQLGTYPIVFALDSVVGDFSAGMLLISTDDFIRGNLRNKLQEVAGEQFVITVNSGYGKEVFSTEELEHTDPVGQNSQYDGPERNLWLFPNYYLTISQKGVSIQDLVRKRSEENLMILSVIFVILIFGLYFLFTNIKRELYLSNAKSEFVSNVSHEIRTPLSLISMFAETLEMGRAKTEEKKQEYYKIIRKETYRLSKIVNSILSFSKMDANKRTYHFEDLDLQNIVNEIMDNYRIQLENEGFEFKKEFEHNGNQIDADKEAVSEAVINLLDNAMKYSDEFKKISIHTGEKDDFTFVEVRDSGVGIPKAYQKEVFDQFFRTPSNNIHKTKGSGLGLTIVKKIMEAHKGLVELESVPSKGSTFRLSFPTINKN